MVEGLVTAGLVWLACSLLNLYWLRCRPYVMATEFRPALIVLAPLAAFFVVFGEIGVFLYKLPQRLTGIKIAQA